MDSCWVAGVWKFDVIRGDFVAEALLIDAQTGSYYGVRGLIFGCHCEAKLSFIFQWKNDSCEIARIPLLFIGPGDVRIRWFSDVVFFVGPEQY